MPTPPHAPGPHPPSSTAFQQFTSRLTRSIHNVFTAASAMLLADDPNATQLFEQLEQLTIASDQSLLYLIDSDGLLQMEGGGGGGGGGALSYPASLPLSMSSMREEYWRSSYELMRLQWAVMDKMRSRHSILKQAAADFWPAQPQPPLPPTPSTIPTADAADSVPSPTASTAKQEEQMDDGNAPSAATAATGSVAEAINADATAMDGEAEAEPEPDSTQHIDLTTPNTDNNNNSPTPPPQPQPLQPPHTDSTSHLHHTATTADAMADTQPIEPTSVHSVLTSPPQQPSPVAESESGTERPEPVEVARSVMDLTDDG